MSCTPPGDLWEKIGSLDDLESMQVLTNLFATYETQQQRKPDDKEAESFFNNLARAVSQVLECNLNRR